MDHRRRLTIALVAGLALAACSGGSDDDARSTTTTDAAVTTDVPGSVVPPPDGQLTDDPGTTFEMLDASADGSQVAFADERGVGVVTVADGSVERLVENTATTFHGAPTFLSDGSIAVVVDDDDEPGGAIAIVRDDGAVEAIPNSPNVIDIDGGPDGLIVFVEVTDGNRSLGAIRVDGTDRRTITDGPNDIDPDVSPDGTDVAFIRVEGTTSTSVSVTAVDGGPVIPLVGSPEGGVVRSPDWAPDGTRLAVSMTVVPADGAAAGEQIVVLDPAVGTLPATQGPGVKPQGVWLSNDELAYSFWSGGTSDGQLFRTAAP